MTPWFTASRVDRYHAKSMSTSMSTETNGTLPMSDEPAQSTFLSPPTLPRPAGYSHVAIAPEGARIVHISGQVAMDGAGNIAGLGDFATQATQAFENLRDALIAAGSSFDHVLKINMFVLDMANLTALREVRDRFVNTDAPPASTLLQVSGFFREGILFEIDAVAVAPG